VAIFRYVWVILRLFMARLSREGHEKLIGRGKSYAYMVLANQKAS
jgi:hypothetical protein